MSDLSQALLKSMLDYDLVTGVFTWRDLHGFKNKGKVAGHVNLTGYLRIKILRREYQAHRLAWFYVHGVWPKEFLDHRDGNRLNNAIANLREANAFQNARNAKHAGYSRAKGGGFRAYIYLAGKQIYLGRHDTEQAAREAYLAASIKHFGDFSSAHREAA